MELSLQSNEKQWYVAVVANNTEASTAEKLAANTPPLGGARGGLEVFVPAQEVVSVWKDGRRKIRKRILLPGKVLIHCTGRERMATMACGLVKRYMVDIASTPDEFGRRKVAVIPDDQVERLKFVLGQSEANVTIDNRNLRAGEAVRVIRGPFCGLEGIVADWLSPKLKVHINIDHLGCASVEVSVNDIERQASR